LANSVWVFLILVFSELLRTDAWKKIFPLYLNELFMVLREVLRMPIEVLAFPDTTTLVVPVASLENKTYDSSNVSLAFEIDEPIVWGGSQS
jgi:hypothetical protein